MLPDDIASMMGVCHSFAFLARCYRIGRKAPIENAGKCRDPDRCFLIRLSFFEGNISLQADRGSERTGNTLRIVFPDSVRDRTGGLAACYLLGEPS